MRLILIALMAWAFTPRPLQVEVAAAERGPYEQLIVEDGRTGFLVRPGDADTLTDRLERLVTDPAEIRRLLVEQVTGMVRWRESVLEMAAAGVTEFVELGGRVLGPMVKRIAPDAKITSVVTIEDVEALAKEIA